MSVSHAEQVDTHPGIPNGWFAVGWSRDLEHGDVRRLKAFDRELALFRTRSGEAKLIDAYCPHLGAHLAEGGRVVGENLRCPFHGWTFDGDGRCVEIPYCQRIPTRARVRSYPVRERNHMIMAWHHAEEKPPSFEVPAISALDDPEWSEPRRFELEVPVHMQDMAENNCDPVHFQFVHGMLETPPTQFELGSEPHFFRVSGVSKRETPWGEFEIDLVRESHGIGMVTVEAKGMPGAGLLMVSSTTPIDAHHTHSRWVLTSTRNIVDLAGAEWFAALEAGVMQDMRIWKNKIHRADPVLCEADEHLAAFRRWTRQWYSRPQPEAR